jgi:hypothetical protein
MTSFTPDNVIILLTPVRPTAGIHARHRRTESPNPGNRRDNRHGAGRQSPPRIRSIASLIERMIRQARDHLQQVRPEIEAALGLARIAA